VWIEGSESSESLRITITQITSRLKMMRLAIIFVFLSVRCFAQKDYDQSLLNTIDEIKQQTIYDNSSVVYNEANGFGSTFPIWKANIQFYQDDIVFHKGYHYRAMVDNKGKMPAKFYDEWTLFQYPRPYLFLRNTATVADLQNMLADTHPFIRTYAFGALAHRNHRGLFKVLIENLRDTTRFGQMTGDTGHEVCPADLMIQYLLSDMTKDQKKTLKDLIDTTYKHVTTGKKLLETK
jgi:hypothetical protein